MWMDADDCLFHNTLTLTLTLTLTDAFFDNAFFLCPAIPPLHHCTFPPLYTYTAVHLYRCTLIRFHRFPSPALSQVPNKDIRRTSLFSFPPLLCLLLISSFFFPSSVFPLFPLFVCFLGITLVSLCIPPYSPPLLCIPSVFPFFFPRYSFPRSFLSFRLLLYSSVSFLPSSFLRIPLYPSVLPPFFLFLRIRSLPPSLRPTDAPVSTTELLRSYLEFGAYPPSLFDVLRPPFYLLPSPFPVLPHSFPVLIFSVLRPPFFLTHSPSYVLILHSHILPHSFFLTHSTSFYLLMFSYPHIPPLNTDVDILHRRVSLRFRGGDIRGTCVFVFFVFYVGFGGVVLISLVLSFFLHSCRFRTPTNQPSTHPNTQHPTPTPNTHTQHPNTNPPPYTDTDTAIDTDIPLSSAHPRSSGDDRADGGLGFGLRPREGGGFVGVEEG
ncbi:hypothetical protein GG344DRAFT_82269 [Lentinula edodes]|nr:hypothetical protein GG344DRAFT_82269 [Lentinula edodes]